VTAIAYWTVSDSLSSGEETNGGWPFGKSSSSGAFGRKELARVGNCMALLILSHPFFTLLTQVPSLRKFLMAKKRKISIEILTSAMAETGLIEEVSIVDPAEMKLGDGDRVVVRLFRMGKDHGEEESPDDGKFIVVRL
jgi:hypothetical protein